MKHNLYIKESKTFFKKSFTFISLCTIFSVLVIGLSVETSPINIALLSSIPLTIIQTIYYIKHRKSTDNLEFRYAKISSDKLTFLSQNTSILDIEANEIEKILFFAPQERWNYNKILSTRIIDLTFFLKDETQICFKNIYEQHTLHNINKWAKRHNIPIDYNCFVGFGLTNRNLVQHYIEE